MEVVKTEGEVKANRVETKIPDLEQESGFDQEPVGSKKRVLLAVDENQFWMLFLGLERLNLIPRLQLPTNKMAKEIHKLGEETYGWVKLR